MKRKLLVLLVSILSLTCNAQIYSEIKYVDRFDDCIKAEQKKTLINIEAEEDSFHIPNGVIKIETKGEKMKTYYPLVVFHSGKMDSIVNLVNDVYGYEATYICIEEKDTTIFNKLLTANEIAINALSNSQKIDSLKNIGMHYDLILRFTKVNLVDKFLKNEKLPLGVVILTNRIISKYHYIFEYKTQYFWVEKNDGSRIIYTKK